MKFNTKERLVLFVGDIVCFLASLFISLFIRYGGDSPELSFVFLLTTWGVIFSASILSFFVAGLYEKHTLIFESGLPSLLLKAQIGNAIIIVVFFYFIPIFGASPKTTLFIYLVTSSVLVFFWRLYGFKFFRSRNRSRAVLFGDGEEVEELFKEINGNGRYPFIFVSKTDPINLVNGEVSSQIINDANFFPVSVVVADLDHPDVKKSIWQAQSLFPSSVLVLSFESVYEEVFDRVPLTLTRFEWLSEDTSRDPHFSYDFLKRVIDIVGATVFSILTTPLFLLASLLVMVSSKGPLFISQDRVGKNNVPFRLFKFRSWLFDDHGDQELHKKNKITAVGVFLRKTRLDELPQLINIFRGELSFIGPRPEIPKLVALYERDVPYYNVRCLIKPGLSGWAQINDYDVPRGTPDVGKTKKKLSYDLYYMKNRTLFLDIKIALRTIQTLLSRSGT